MRGETRCSEVMSERCSYFYSEPSSSDPDLLVSAVKLDGRIAPSLPANGSIQRCDQLIERPILQGCLATAQVPQTHQETAPFRIPACIVGTTSMRQDLANT